MRIKKTTPAVGVVGKVLNVPNNSTEDTYSCDYLNDSLEDIYSTDEVVTNKVWINGKPIYRKVIDIGSLPNTTTKDVETNLSSDCVFINVYGYGLKTVGEIAELPIPFIRQDYGYVSVGFVASNGTWSVRIITGSDRSNFSGYVVLEYTKTDSSASV